MKYCKDCKWVERRGWFFKTVPNTPRCLNPKLADEGGDSDYLITGEPKKPPYAEVMRSFDCGHEAKYFEPND